MVFHSQIVGSFFVAKETAIILRQVVSISRWRDAHVLIDIVTQVGIRLASAQPNGKNNYRLCNSKLTSQHLVRIGYW